MKTFKELFAGTGIEPTTDENGGIHYNFNATLKKEPMKLTSTETTNTSFLVSTLERPCGTVYINPYKLCEKCGKQEKNANSLFALPNECHCPSPKTDLELLQDEVKSLTKKVNKLIKQQQINK